MPNAELEIKRAAAAEQCWREGDLVVAPILGLVLHPCFFFSVSQRRLPVHQALSYGYLPNGTIVSQRDPAALEKILAECDARAASAASWAELLARFHWDVGPGEVLYRPAPALGVGEAPKGPISAPEITIGSEREVHFFLRNQETQKLYEVRAVVTGRKVLRVSKEKIEAPPPSRERG